MFFSSAFLSNPNQEQPQLQHLNNLNNSHQNEQQEIDHQHVISQVQHQEVQIPTPETRIVVRPVEQLQPTANPQPYTNQLRQVICALIKTKFLIHS